MWKPGQIVTICGKVCRIRKTKPLYDGSIRDCIFCTFTHLDACAHPCLECCFTSFSHKLPQGCHLEAIK